MHKIYVDEIPETETVDRYISRLTKSDEKWYMVSRQYKETTLEFKILDYDHDKLTQSTLEALDTFGFNGWQTKDSTNSRYGGLSFVSNPNHINNDSNTSNTLGTVAIDAHDYYDPSKSKDKILKNTYYDSWGFTQPSELASFKYIGKFLQGRQKRTLIRSRLAVMKAGHWNSEMTRLAWHRDEPIYQNLRINIPITTTPEYMFQLEDKDPEHLKIGHAYTWDTRRPHGVFQTGETTVDRVHFVLGYNPWFDYDPINKCWVQNDFWGKHPFQMLIDGDIFTGIELVSKR